MKQPKKLITLRIEPPLLDSVREFANKEGINQSKYIRKAIEEKVEFDENFDIQ